MAWRNQRARLSHDRYSSNAEQPPKLYTPTKDKESPPTKTEYSFHEVCTVFPAMTETEFAALEEDIQAHGLKEPITRYQGKIIDGRSRFLACQNAAVEPRFEDWDEKGSLVEFVVSKNLKRRHLTVDQRAAFAAEELLPRYEAEAKERERLGGKPEVRKGREKIPHPKGKARDHAALVVGVNPRYVSDYKKIKERDSKLGEEVKKGSKKIVEVKRIFKEKEREAKREENKKLVESGKAPKVKQFATIVIDPPWDYGDEGDIDQFGRGRPTYVTKSEKELEDLLIQDWAQDNAHIYLWITNRSLPKGFVLLKKWGFRYVTCLTWCKPSIGMGNYFRGSTEHILFGVKGELPLLRKDIGTWFEAERGKEHSEKPDKFYKLVEQCSPSPWVDFFGRKERPGWVVLGGELGVQL